MARKRSNQVTEESETPLKKQAKTDLIIDQLNSTSDALEALKTIANNENEELKQLLNQGGTGKDLINIFTNSVDKLKAPDISIVFNACEVFLIHLATNLSTAQAEDDTEKMKKLGIELVKELLEDHLGYIMLLLSGSNTVYQVKSSLRLLTSMVTCCSQTAKELLLKVDFEHKHWESVSKRQSGEIRQAFIQFLLSFFVINHTGIAKEFIEKKSMLASIMPGLVRDDSELVLLVLTSFKEHILENSGLSKTAKMKLFSVYNLKHFISLFDWKGPTGGSEDTSEESKKVSKELIIDANIEFLVTAFTSTKHGLVFQDLSFGTSGTNLNLLLFNFLVQLVEPWSRPELAKVVIAALGSCPDQIRPYIGKVLQPLWKPRPSPAWYQVIDFLFAILEAIDIGKIKQELIDKNKQLSMIVSNFCCNEKVFKEVILETLKVDNHLVKVKGLELQALLLNKIEVILKDEKVGSGPKKQILFRLQDKVPELNQVVEIWTKEVQMNSIVEIDTSNKDDMETNGKNDFLLPLTQILSFYLNYYPEKYSSSDLNLEQMLQQTNQDKYWLIQLHLLKHLVTSQYGISANQQHLQTLVNIACNNFNDENGDLATEALFGLLAKQDLCLNIMDLKVWFAFVHTGKSKKLCDILAETILNLLNKEKDTIFEEIKLELNKLGDSFQIQSSQDIDDLMEKLCDSDFKMDTEEDSQEYHFILSPLLWSLMRSHSLMHHKAYFEKCLSASLVIQENPQCFLELLKNQDFRSFPNLKSQQVLNLSPSQHEEFDQKLHKMQLLASLKLNINAINLEDFKPIIESEDNLDWILKDQQIIKLFEPSKSSTLVDILIEIFPKVYSTQASLLLPYIKKTMQTILEAIQEVKLEPIETLGKVIKSLPIQSEDLSNLLENICLKIQNGNDKKSLVRFLDLSLSKLIQVDKWSLSNLSISLVKTISNVIEDSISQQTCSSSLLENIGILMQINDEFSSMLTKTHLSLACDAGYIDLISTMIRCNPQNVAFFKKWLTLNPSQMLNFGSILLEILQENEVKSKSIQSLKQQLMDKQDLNELDEDLIKVLVEKYQQTFNEIQDKLKIGKALLAQLKAKNDSKGIAKKIVVPIMLEISKKKLANQDLLVLALQDLDVKLMKISEFKEVWNDFVKICLKYGLKNEAGLVHVLKVMFDKVLQEDNHLATETYQLICGHSQFVSILFSTEESKKKSNLLGLILTLIQSDPSICSSLQVPVYLGAYNATKSDRTLYEILYLHENQGSINLQAFKPLVWGQAAISKYSKNSTKIVTKSQKVSEILALIDNEKMMESALNFDKTDAFYYDAQFFLPLICQLCAPDNFVDKHLKLVESGCLALAFGGLSCKDLKLRQLALVTLSRIYQQLEKARKSLSAEKQVWLHLIDVVRNGLINVLNTETRVPPRIPHLTTSFLIKSTQILSNPLDPMFKSISSFVLAKPMMDLFVMPEFLRLFHSNDVIHHQLEQEWILKVIQVGLQDELDYGILQQNFIPKMILSFAGSALASNSIKAKNLVLGIIEKMSCLTSPAYDMIKTHGLLLWLLNMVHQKTWDFHQIANIICTLWNSIQANANPQTLFELHQIIDEIISQVSDEDFKKILVQVLKHSLKKSDVWREQLMTKLCQKAALISDSEVDAVIIHLIHV